MPALGMCFQFADGGDKAISFDGEHFYLGNPFGGGGEGITAEVHGSGAGVVCVAGEPKIETGLADDAGNRGYAEPFGFEDRPLFDMNFYKTNGIPVGGCFFERTRIDPEVFDCLLDGCAIGILGARTLDGSNRPATARLPMKVEMKIGLFFFTECDDFEADGEFESFGRCDQFKRYSTDAKDAKSNAPASGTVSICEPRIRRLPDAPEGFQIPRRLPTASTRTFMPRFSIRARRC